MWDDVAVWSVLDMLVVRKPLGCREAIGNTYNHMSDAQDFLSQNPSLDEGQVSALEVESSDPSESDFSCGLRFDRSEGDYSIMVALRSTSVIVSTIRNGRLTSRMRVNLGRGHELRLLSRDNRNYDGYAC